IFSASSYPQLLKGDRNSLAPVRSHASRVSNSFDPFIVSSSIAPRPSRKRAGDVYTQSLKWCNHLRKNTVASKKNTASNRASLECTFSDDGNKVTGCRQLRGAANRRGTQ